MVLLLVFVATACLRADFYEWKDKKGVTHVTTMPPKKTGAASKVKVIRAKSYPPASASSQRSSSGAPLNLSVPARPSVELYTTSWCGFCTKARSYLSARGVPFTEYDVERDPEAARRMQQVFRARGVPVAVINGQVIQGFSESAYNSALGF